MNCKVLLVGTLTSKLNGSARSFVKVGKALREKGNNVVSVLPNSEGIHAESVLEHDKVLIADVVPLRRSIGAFLRIPYSVIEFSKIIKRERPGVVHINDIPWFYLILVVRLFGAKVSIHSRYVEPNPLVSSIIKAFLRHAHCVLFVSEFNKRLWEYPHKNGVVLNNPGVFLEETPGRSVDDGRESYMLVVSRISPDKGILESIKLFYLLSKANNDSEVRLKIAGGCQYPYQEIYGGRCRQLAEDLGISSRIDWLGLVEETAPLYVGAIAYIHLPNFEDPFPTTIMEALASGIYIITNGRGGILEQVEGFSGVCVIDQTILDKLQSVESSSVGDFCLGVLKGIELPSSSIFRYDRKALYSERFSWDAFSRRLQEHVCL